MAHWQEKCHRLPDDMGQPDIYLLFLLTLLLHARSETATVGQCFWIKLSHRLCTTDIGDLFHQTGAVWFSRKYNFTCSLLF